MYESFQLLGPILLSLLCLYILFKEITVFYLHLFNTPELQPGPGLKKGSLKSKGDGGTRERPLACPSEGTYEQSAAMCPGKRALWAINQPQKRSLLPKPHHFWCLSDISSFWLARPCNSLQVAMGHTWGPNVEIVTESQPGLPLDTFILSYFHETKTFAARQHAWS